MSPQQSSGPVDFKTVHADELKEIEARRRVVGIKSNPVDSSPEMKDGHAPLQDRYTPDNDLVGLALSGGGLRSAMFNLGLLQALHSSGLMRFVDYLSTVSGGGYVGGFYSGLGHTRAFEHLSDSTHSNTVDSFRGGTGEYSRHVPRLEQATHRFINAGHYLNQPYAFLSSFVVPTALIFSLYVTAVATLSCVVALFFRCFDLPIVVDRLTYLGIETEMGCWIVAVISFFGLLKLCYWMRVIVSDRHLANERKRGLWVSFGILSLLCGFAIAIGNYDFGVFPQGIGLSFQRDFQLPIAVIAVLATFAIVKMPLLLRSQQVTASLWQKAGLWFVLSAAVGGGTLSILSYIGSEGVSGFPTYRDSKFTLEEIVDDNAFALVVKEFGIDSTDYAESWENFDAADRASFPEKYQTPATDAVSVWATTGSRIVDYIQRCFFWAKPDWIEKRDALRTARDRVRENFNEKLFDPPTQTSVLIAKLNERLPCETRGDLKKALVRPRGLPFLGADEFLSYVNGFRIEQAKTEQAKTGPEKGIFLEYRPGLLSAKQEQAFCRFALEALYPQVFRQMRFVSTPVVVQRDQMVRCWLFVWTGAIFVVLCRVVDVNSYATFHSFYKSRIARTFINAALETADDKLCRFQPHRISGFPYPLITAALKLPGSVDINEVQARELERNVAKLDGSVGSEWYSFLFSPAYVGYLPVLPNSGKSQPLKSYRASSEYRGGELRVSDAVTLSGAAFTPWMANTPALNILMHVFNLRLEQWLPNPADSVATSPESRFHVDAMLRETLRCSSHKELKNWKYGVVADGGFREFLGVEELIARRCRIIIASDAGCNNGISEFGVLADLVRQVRLDHAIEILDLDHDLPLDTERIRRSNDANGRQHFIVGRIRYPEKFKGQPLYERTGLFVYLQMSLTGDEDVDLAQFRKINPTFPDEPITNQFFSADQVESLRQLGEHVGRHLCQRLDPEAISRINSIQRIEDLANAFIASYLVECRQEQLTNDETPRTDIRAVRALDLRAIAAFQSFEERGERSPALAWFASYVIEGCSTGHPRVPFTPEQEKSLASLRPEDLAGLAVECNRRYAGFRSENPDRFFRVGGRRLLLSTTTIAIQRCRIFDKPSDKSGSQGFDVLQPQHLQELLRNELIPAIARLAVVVPNGIFREHGNETSRDLVLCVLAWLQMQMVNTWAPQDQSPSLTWLDLERLSSWHWFRRGLLSAIETSLEAEVERYLISHIVEDEPRDAAPANAKARDPIHRGSGV